MWDVILIRPGHRCAGAYTNIRHLVHKILHVHMGHASDRGSLLGRILQVSAHHTSSAILTTHHPLISLLVSHHPAIVPLSAHHPITIAISRQSTVRRAIVPIVLPTASRHNTIVATISRCVQLRIALSFLIETFLPHAWGSISCLLARATRCTPADDPTNVTRLGFAPTWHVPARTQPR
jgi:hypothetical protein